MVLVKNWTFLQLFKLSKVSPEEPFSNVLDRIISFLGCKNIYIKRSQNFHFFKGVSPWFWLKIGHFFHFSF